MTEQRVQRRLAAIMSADVVGYSRLMGADEAGTLSCAQGTAPQLDKTQSSPSIGAVW